MHVESEDIGSNQKTEYYILTFPSLTNDKQWLFPGYSYVYNTQLEWMQHSLEIKEKQMILLDIEISQLYFGILFSKS